jgi:hypothetical protein
MCQFCTEHGEGKTWYLQMKNYSEDLLHSELSAEERETARAGTRAEWLARGLELHRSPHTLTRGKRVPSHFKGLLRSSFKILTMHRTGPGERKGNPGPKETL